MKGTITPNNTIIASNSLLNKNYIETPPYSVLAGTPAKLVKSGVKRIFE
jgi:acetyltransferase-like isoleucine patch superfamily enzyme